MTGDMHRLHRYCSDERPWLEHLIERLVRCESPSTDKAAVDRLADLVSAELAAIGARVDRLPRRAVGDHVRAEVGDGPTQVLLLGHLDTVWPAGQLDRMPIHREAGRLYGPGVFDMKAGIALALLALRALHQLGFDVPRRTVLLLTSDEEIGSGASRTQIETEADRSSAVLVLEPALPGGGVKTSRKGVGEYRIEARGVAAHAGIEPERGVSAITEIAHQVLALAELQDVSRGVTITVGRIEGGTRTNVVPDHAAIDVDVRVPTSEDADVVARRIGRLAPRQAGASLSVTGGMNRPPLERSVGVVRLYTAAKAIAAELGRELGEGGSGGGSDGNFTGARGVPTLDGLGAIGGGAHAADEHVDLEPLPWRAALVAGLVLRAP
jgi:glutamate carboxypeptidase